MLLVAVLEAFAPIGPAGAAGTGVGQSGNIVPGAAAAQQPFTPDSPFDSGQPIDVIIPANGVFTPGANIFILECAAPNGVPPTTSASCDGETGYQGGTITVQPDGSIDVMDLASDSQNTTSFGNPYTIYALPDAPTLHESPANTPVCGLGVANECMLYIGQGGGGDTGFAQPHFFSQAFQVHPDPTDSGALNPGDGSPEPTSGVSSTLSTVTPASQTVTADGVDHANVTVTLNDQSSVGVPGKTVTLTATGGATVVPASSGSDVTDASGQATFYVKDTTAQTVTLTATDTTDTIGVSQTAQATFTAPTLNPTSSKVSANPTTVPADGSTPSTVTVTLVEQFCRIPRRRHW